MCPHIKARLEYTGRAAVSGRHWGIIKRRLHPLRSVSHTHIYSSVVSRNSLKIPTTVRENGKIIYWCPFFISKYKTVESQVWPFAGFLCNTHQNKNSFSVASQKESWSTCNQKQEHKEHKEKQLYTMCNRWSLYEIHHGNVHHVLGESQNIFCVLIYSSVRLHCRRWLEYLSCCF